MENQNTPNQTLLTTKEVAHILNCGVLNVIKHYNRGNLKGIKHPNGRYLLFYPADVEYFINSFKFFRTTIRRKELNNE